ncbi:MAG: ATP-dependent DNA helicase RecG [Granulosicoccus sp.]
MSATSDQSLDRISVIELQGVGQSMAGKLETLGIHTVQDVLFHLPYRYQNRTRLSRIAELCGGQEALVQGQIWQSEVVTSRRRSLIVRLRDDSGELTLRFFHFNTKQQAQFRKGALVQCYGEVRRGYSALEIVHPEYRIVTANASANPLLTATLTPFYHATDGVKQLTLRKLTDQALERLSNTNLPDYLQPFMTADADTGFPDLISALKTVHRPPPDVDTKTLVNGAHPAHRRLAMEELVAHRLGLRLLRNTAQSRQSPRLRPQGRLLDALRESLHFQLTDAQNVVLLEIINDMGSESPMLRLVQGDVGSGKTIVAALAAAQVVESGYQVAVMAPTEILAEQHLLNFNEWFEPLGIGVAWLSGKLRVSQRRAAIESIAMGQQAIVVGTHALFQKDVEFEKLGLAIIDEQHRFGVHQRMALREKGQRENVHPHQLIMTATPIPRTLAMTAYADLDVSIINELPPGRLPVKTVAVDNGRRAEVVERVDAAICKSRQVYWVCTLIEESESLQAEAAENTLQYLSQELPAHSIELIHGRLKSREKETVMQAFKQGNIDLLIATTVIEVGVDVPNASLMIIENAERLGLSQLHQLRGRVGRGSLESTCILLYQSPLSDNARERLGIMRETNDGFVIAQKDLHLRGAGEVLGTRQTGLAEFRIARLDRDDDLLDRVCQLADEILLHSDTHKHELIRRWLGDTTQEYGRV